MSRLIRYSNLAAPDAVYQRLVELQSHEDRNVVAARNARLVLLLANHIGDLETVMDAIDVAMASDAGAE